MGCVLLLMDLGVNTNVEELNNTTQALTLRTRHPCIHAQAVWYTFGLNRKFRSCFSFSLHFRYGKWNLPTQPRSRHTRITAGKTTGTMQ